MTQPLYELYESLFELGKHWYSPIYVCSASAERWDMHESIDGVGETLRGMARAIGWMTHRAEGLWEVLAGSVRLNTPWHHNISQSGFEELAWDRFLVLARRVREMCVPNFTWADQVLPNGPGPRWLATLPDPVRCLVSEEGYLQGAAVPFEETSGLAGPGKGASPNSLEIQEDATVVGAVTSGEDAGGTEPQCR